MWLIDKSYRIQHQLSGPSFPFTAAILQKKHDILNLGYFRGKEDQEYCGNRQNHHLKMCCGIINIFLILQKR